MPAIEYTCWQLFFGMYPFGYRATDIQTGSIKQTIAAVNAKPGTDLPLSKFLLRHKTQADKLEEEKRTFAYLDRIGKRAAK